MITQNHSDERARSRRNFIAKAGAFLAVAGVAENLTAQSSNDLDILNFALRLERLEASFYNAALTKFTQNDFNASNIAQSLTPSFAGSVYPNLQAIAAHENTHVMQLSGLITKLGGTPVGPDCYGFSPFGGDLLSLKTADSVLATAMALENTGVMAYDGGLGLIQDAGIRTTAATIATVEARHAAYLNQLNGQSPFPSAFDTAAAPADILNAASKFVVSCAIFPPTAVAGPKGKSTSSRTFDLDATASRSSDGSPIVGYVWETVLGNNANVTNASTAKPTVTFNGGPGIYTFVLMITDAHGNTATDAVKVNYTGG